MDIHLDRTLASYYHSHTQIVRVLTENWMGNNMYCPHCGNPKLVHCKNNLPVEDFYCPYCGNEYELKSKSGSIKNKITDGAYETMISRITSKQNPNFFFLSYSKADFTVQDLIFIPKFFFYPAIIEKRKPLAKTARRAGWIGCNILIDSIPSQGRISIITGGVEENKEQVLQNTKNSSKLYIQNIHNRGWQMEVLNCINSINSKTFSLQDIYQFERAFQEIFTENHHIKEKIRQQLQQLRDKGIIKFLAPGHYLKL